MYSEKELLVIYEHILINKCTLIEPENINHMKLLMCFKCGDIFNLTREEKICSCGETKGHYTDNLNAEIEGDCQPIGIANDSFRLSLKAQKIQDKLNKKDCKGVEFTAFFIPEKAKSICKL